jgi:type IV pilus assembly protein PilC
MNQLEVLFQQLAMAAHAGLPLRDVLEILRKEGGYQGTLLAAVGQRLDRGAALSEALSSAGAVFSRETVEFVRAAEDKAMLPAVLDALALDYSRRAAGRRAVLKAIYWPAALAFALVLLLALALIFVMPAFKAVYADFGADLPAPTLLLVSISDFMFGYWQWMASLVLLAAVGWYLSRRRAVLWLPLIHPFREKLFQLRLAAMLALAAGAEASFATAAFAHLGATAPTARSSRWIDPLIRRLASGANLFGAMRETAQVPPRVAAMLELGSRTGNMAGARAYIESWCDAEFEEALPKFETDVLIAAYVVIGVALGFFVIALYLPIFRLASAV